MIVPTAIWVLSRSDDMDREQAEVSTRNEYTVQPTRGRLPQRVAKHAAEETKVADPPAADVCKPHSPERALDTSSKIAGHIAYGGRRTPRAVLDLGKRTGARKCAKWLFR